MEFLLQREWYSFCRSGLDLCGFRFGCWWWEVARGGLQALSHSVVKDHRDPLLLILVEAIREYFLQSHQSVRSLLEQSHGHKDTNQLIG